MKKNDVIKKIKKLLNEQKLGILSTLGNRYPYQSLVAFAGSKDIKYILFATKRATTKYKNLKNKTRVSIFIDNCSNQERDFLDATGMTVLGDAHEVKGLLKKKLVKPYLRKHPSLENFVLSPDCVLFMIKVKTYYVVWRFQEVRELIITQ